MTTNYPGSDVTLWAFHTYGGRAGATAALQQQALSSLKERPAGL